MNAALKYALDLAEKWIVYRGSINEPERYSQLARDLYQVRNPGGKNPDINFWPANLIDSDVEIMAAIEHYFLCRNWVGNAIFPVWQVEAMRVTYDLAKLMGVAPRHNKNNPTTPITELQVQMQILGVKHGEKDLLKSGKKAPRIAKPPKYW